MRRCSHFCSCEPGFNGVRCEHYNFFDVYYHLHEASLAGTVGSLRPTAEAGPAVDKVVNATACAPLLRSLLIRSVQIRSVPFRSIRFSSILFGSVVFTAAEQNRTGVRSVGGAQFVHRTESKIGVDDCCTSIRAIRVCRAERSYSSNCAVLLCAFSAVFSTVLYIALSRSPLPAPNAFTFTCTCNGSPRWHSARIQAAQAADEQLSRSFQLVQIRI